MKQYESINNLRFWLVVMVVLHHAVLAYHSFFNYSDVYMVAGIIPISNMINPIIDSTKFQLFDLITGINDTYFMSTLFFISGLFVWRSLEKKGAKAFVISRLKRLGIPFIIGVLVLIPLAYYPAALQYASLNSVKAISITEFWTGVASTGFISGPFWFVLVLLTFDVLAALVFGVRSKRIKFQEHKSKEDKLIEVQVGEQKNVPAIFRSTVLLFIVLTVLSAAVYLPMLQKFDAFHWLSVGAINFQTSRIIHYLLYFTVGVVMGRVGIDKTVFGTGGSGIKYIGWLAFGLVAFFILFLIPGLQNLLLSVLSAAFTIGLVGFFMKYCQSNRGIARISKYAFGIYVSHYTISSWIQFILLESGKGAFEKGITVFAGTMVIGIIIAAIYRMSPLEGKKLSFLIL